ncbi:CMP-N,N'-diacetyllegionaminic acid synthase [Alkalicoccobacillus murimartini]|uniref:CMP-N,N'-diacetyllegionaminic acid synthase n=1 Tax=Alkalicoccobacillus murimartini TaxID=171685 RepID=A0ABT9YGD9_9BACI|nr:CMP-N,N'-diacetyllegionaminic acid synthase [Alkalicoccobacillus murimartini]
MKELYQNKRIVAIIPARGGSKGIPKKNIILVNGKPLIQYSIDAALQSNYIDDVLVSTECPEIARISREVGAKVPFLRPPHLALDESKTIDSIVYTIVEQKKRGIEYDLIVVLQPTQPLRKSWHVDHSIEQIEGSQHNGLVSVSKVKDHPILIRQLHSDHTVSSLLSQTSTVRRQDFSDYYKVNGAIYINKASSLTNNTSLNDNSLAFVMDQKYDLDIDNPLDLELLKIILSNPEHA